MNSSDISLDSLDSPSPGATIRVDRAWNGAVTPEELFASLRLIRDSDTLVVDITASYTQMPRPQVPVGRCWKLWEHEVVELFVAGPGERYTEFEFGPHGHYLALALDGVRHIVDDRLPVDYTARIQGNQWHARAIIAREHLPAEPHRFNATLIGQAAGRVHHLSWCPLAGDAPDFHQPSLFRPVAFAP